MNLRLRDSLLNKKKYASDKSMSSGSFYQWMLSVAGHPRAVWLLIALSFTESFVSPIPPDPLLLPMCLANRSRMWWYATVCIVASVIGGLVGYYLGFALFDSFGQKIIHFYGLEEKYLHLKDLFSQYAFWIIALKGFTPIPYKLVTITSGIAKVPFITFISASILARGIRFALLTGLAQQFGPQLEVILRRHMLWVTIISLVIILGIVYVFQWF